MALRFRKGMTPEETPMDTLALRTAASAAWDLVKTEASWLLVFLLAAFAYVKAFSPLLADAQLHDGLLAGLMVALIAGVASWAGWLPVLVADEGGGE